MHDIHPYRPNALTQSPLDKATHRRADESWIAEQLRRDESQFVIVWRGRTLMQTCNDGSVTARLLPHDMVADFLPAANWAYLGFLDSATVFALDLSMLDDPLPADLDATLQDLRRVGGSVAPKDAALMAHARGLMHWRNRHRYCGVCGATCTPSSAGHVLLCQGCGIHHFPRTDPAVIMLVTHGDRALLGQPNMLRAMRVFTTLAGFVEPGESLEEAVAREVFEETGVRATRARYHSSQPWPFPASMMLGFHADALTQDITIDRAELADARWFTRAELLEPDGFILPPDFSIARRLIDEWLHQAQ